MLDMAAYFFLQIVALLPAGKAEHAR